jgi:hypothetical protein
MKVRDSRKRKIKNSEGNSYIFYLRRFKCPNCGSIHLEAPDLINPNKHYSRVTIENTVNGNIDFCAADNRTIARWKK